MVLRSKTKLNSNPRAIRLSMDERNLERKTSRKGEEMTQNQIRWQEHLENKRHNVEMEKQGSRSQDEIERHQRVVESETARSNLANEDLKRQGNVINDMHFMRSDAEMQRSNIAKERENLRHNRATEYLGQLNYTLGMGNLQEQQLHDRNTEALQASEIEVKQSQADTAQYKAEQEHHDRSFANTTDRRRMLDQMETNQTVRKANTAKAAESNARALQSASDAIFLTNSRRVLNYTSAFRNAVQGLGDVVDIASNLLGGKSNGRNKQQSINYQDIWNSGQAAGYDQE
nr:putative ORF1 [Marmot picobirnavirus]